MSRRSIGNGGAGPSRTDRGSATIFTAAAGLALTLVAVLVATSATKLISRAQARSAADFAALGGAASARFGEEVACARASKLATDNHAVLVSCLLEGFELTVAVEVNGFRAVARAGPERTAVGDPDAG